MPNIIINFEVNQTGADDLLDTLTNTGKAEKTLADNAKAANTVLQEQQKQFSGASSNAQQLAVATGNIAKSITGGAFTAVNTAIAKLASTTSSSTEKFGELYKAINTARQALSQLDPGSANFAKLSSEIAAAEKALTGFDGEAVSGRARLRQYRDTLLQLEEAGLENTQVFNDLATAAGELGDQVGDTQQRIRVLGSDTFGFDVALSAVQGLAGGFAVVQGAAALFGSESEDLQKALLKVNAAMSILQGLQQIQNLLQAQSALYIGAQIALQRLATLQTNLQAAAESRFIVIRYAAAVAQRVLNAVMAANPAGVVLVAIAALATALLILTSGTDDASEAQKKLNQQLELSIKLNEQAAKVAQQASNIQLATLKKNRADAQTLRDAEAQSLRDQVIIAKDSYDKATAVVDSYGKDVSKLSKDELVNRTDALKQQQDVRQKYFDLENQLAVRRLQNQKAAEDDSLKSATASADARVLQAVKGSQAELKATIAAIAVRQQEELKAEGITAGEREKIIAQNAREIAALRLEITQKNLEDQIAVIQAAGLREQDTYKKLQNDIEAVLLTAQKDLLGKNSAQAQLIEAQRDEAIRSLRKSHYAQLTALDQDYSVTFTTTDKTRIQGSIARAQELLALNQKNAQEELARIQAKAEAEKAAYIAVSDVALTTASSLAGSLNTIAQNQTEAQVAELQRQLDAKLITQQQYDRAVRRLAHDQAVRDKNTAIFQAEISLAQSVLKVLSDKSIPVYLQALYIALNTAAAGFQIAALRSKAIPAYATGTDNATGGPSLVAEEGAELIYQKGRMHVVKKPSIIDLMPGAKVFTAEETASMMNAYNMAIPSLPANFSIPVAKSEKIDYNRLAQLIGKEIGKIPFGSTEITEKGIRHIVTSVESRKRYLENRFKSL
jgi:hypothetical protein